MIDKSTGFGIIYFRSSLTSAYREVAVHDIKELAKECSRTWKRSRRTDRSVTMSAVMTQVLEKHGLSFVSNIRHDIGKELNRMRQAARHRDKETEKHLEAEAEYLIGSIRPEHDPIEPDAWKDVEQALIEEHLEDPNVQHFLSGARDDDDEADPWDNALDKAS
jgi:hypothetical protein